MYVVLYTREIRLHTRVVLEARQGAVWALHSSAPATMPPLRLNAVAFVSPQNHPILIRTFAQGQDDLKYHYIAHTSLDVIDERSASLLAS